MGQGYGILASRSRPSYAPKTPATDRITVGRTAMRATSAPRDLFAAGDRVRHATFGDGIILSVQKMGADHLYEIAFDKTGTKKLMATYAKLQKL